MYEQIYGKILALTPTSVVVDGGSGMAMLAIISLNTYTQLQKQNDCRLYVHLQVREDAWTLYGFADEAERALFRMLTGVSGVGASTAMLMLSGMGVSQLQNAIAGGDAAALKNVKGVGAKTAERIIVDLRDKIKVADATLLVETSSDNASAEEALAALVMLGYTRPAAQKALKKIFVAEPDATAERAIKLALAML